MGNAKLVITEHLLKWHKGSRPVYALASPPCEDQPEAQLYSIELTEMIERNAIAGTDNWYLPKTRQAREVCWMLEDAGLVDSAKHPARGWQLADGVFGLGHSGVLAAQQSSAGVVGARCGPCRHDLL